MKIFENDDRVSFFSEYIMYHLQYFALLSTTTTKVSRIKYENENIFIRVYIFNILWMKMFMTME